MSYPIKTHVFPNGFRIIYQHPANQMPTAHMNVFCHVGSANEEEHTRGAAHVVEHMCFQGTEKRPKSRDLEIIMDNAGATFNAHTDKPYTWYEINCLDQHVPVSLDILSDMMLHSVFRKSIFEREMHVVIEENMRDLTNYQNTVFDDTDTMLYRGSMYEFPIDSLQYHRKPGSLSHKEVVAFYRKHYFPANMILSITTRIPFATICRMVERTAFCSNTTTRQLEPVLNPAPRMILEPQTKYRLHCRPVANMKSIYMTISFRVCSFYNVRDTYGLKFLENLIGGRVTSRLFTILRENHGLTYQSSAKTAFYENAGGFTLYAISDSTKLLKNGTSQKGVLPLVIELLNGLLAKGVTDEEIRVTKSYLRSSIEIDLENANLQSYYNGSQLLLMNDPPVPIDQLYSTHYARFTRKDATRLLRLYFKRENMCVALVGGGIPKESILDAELAKFRG